VTVLPGPSPRRGLLIAVPLALAALARRAMGSPQTTYSAPPRDQQARADAAAAQATADQAIADAAAAQGTAGQAIADAAAAQGDANALEGIAFVDGWTDLVVLATAVNPPGSIGPAVPDLAESTLDYQNGSDQRADYSYQIPHQWKVGSNVRFHIHCWHSTAGAGNVQWTLKWRILPGPPGGAVPAWTTDPPILTVAPGNTSHTIVNIKTFNMAGQTISAVIQCQLTRNGGADSYAGDVKMTSADCHYQSDTATGSTGEGTK
jgi:hypothetical protein